MIRPRLSVTLCALALLLGCGSQAGPTESGGSVSPNQARRVKAPAFELMSLSGDKVSLSKLKGKVVFLDFWATWCPPCIMSLPLVEKLVKDYRGKSVEFVSISLDQTEGVVTRFVREKGVTNKVIMAGDSDISSRYQIRGIPAFFIIDKEGYVVDAWDGYHPSLEMKWREDLDRLLKMK